MDVCSSKRKLDVLPPHKCYLSSRLAFVTCKGESPFIKAKAKESGVLSSMQRQKGSGLI